MKLNRAFILAVMAVVLIALAAAGGIWALGMRMMGHADEVKIGLLVYLPAAAVAVEAALPVALAAASYFSSRAMRPARMAADRLRQVADGSFADADAYPVPDSDVPGMWELDSLLAGIWDRLRQSGKERERIESILDSMSEGLVVLDPNLRILLINHSAAAFFGVDAEVRGSNLLHMTHLPRAVDAARHAAKYGQREVFDLRRSGRTLQVLVSPVRDGDAEAGAILLVTDVTAVRMAEQIRSDFVANASHELKTPLTAIKGFAELMQQGIIREPQEVERTVSLIVAETDRMIQLISDILKLSELESEVTDTGAVAVSLRLTAQKAAESLALQAKEHEVTVDVEGDIGTVYANPDRMMELALNLMDNAVKYNRPGGSVTVSIWDKPDHVTLSVADTGVGIPREAQDRVFERFYRVDKGRSRRQGGTGLGLSIVKHIVGLYKGEIRLRSEPGAGTTIEVDLPVR